MHKLHGTVATNRKQILSLAYFFTIHIQIEHRNEEAPSVTTHMQLEVKITFGGSSELF
jgi:hypothetical protein